MDFLEGDRARLEPSGPSKRRPSHGEWYVTSQGNFWPSSHRERPGVQLPFRGEFDWAGFHWLVPGVYSTAKALVVDFCRQVEPADGSGEPLGVFLPSRGGGQRKGVPL